MSNFLFVIDGYLSNYQRVSVCDELITQLKKTFPDKKILLINKFNDSFGLDSKVDYYFYFGDGFMVGPPPNEIVEDKRYCKPYVYMDTSAGVLENWMPYVGVSDHVANVYNGFIMSSRIAKNLGYDKVFRIEYDMLFHKNELDMLKEHLKKFESEDYLIYGRRKEGSWIAEYLSLIDLHFCGYSNKLIEGFDLVKNDSDYWRLCDQIQHWGKWCEYTMSMVFEKNLKKLNGTEFHENVRNLFGNSYFDRISSSGFWENKWTDMPKICRVSRDNGLSESEEEIVVFYWNNDADLMKLKVSTNFGYKKDIQLNRGVWTFDVLQLSDDMKFDCTVERDDNFHSFKQTIEDKDLSNLNTRFLIK